VKTVQKLICTVGYGCFFILVDFQNRNDETIVDGIPISFENPPHAEIPSFVETAKG
jgi:hypothetical protein